MPVDCRQYDGTITKQEAGDVAGRNVAIAKGFSMRFSFMALVLLAAATAQAETIIVRGPATAVTAQDHAVVLARRGTLVHSHCNQYEGIGTGSTADQARRNCCFFQDAMRGRRVIVDEGVAYSPSARKYFAVIRYR
jgi:hypothetical protein